MQPDSSHSESNEELKEMRSEIEELKPSKNPRIVKLQDLELHNIRELNAWSEERPIDELCYY